ncbi:hypothetical protein ACKUSY_17265 [Myroides odoratus]
MMKNKLGLVLTLLISLWVSNMVLAQQARQFPYFISLTGDEKPDAITEYFGVTDIPVPDERYSDRGIALTYKVGDREQTFTGFALDDIEFTSQFGIIVEFKYAMIEGHTFNGRYGDGLAMFLYDSSKNFEIGAHGASLGYAYRNNDGGASIPGLNGGYLGVGLDVYGDFKVRSVIAHERKEGISYQWEQPGSHVTIRGAQYMNDRHKGYPVLYTINTDFRRSTNRAKLVYATGDYDYHDEQFTKRFDLRPEYDYDGNIAYNTVTVKIIPNHEREGSEVEVKVRDRYGEGNIIDKFFYPNTFKTRDQNNNLYDFETKIPDQFKIGFAAGTGGAFQVQLVKDVRVTLPYQPETEDVQAVFCSGEGNNDGRKVRFDPYENSNFYTGSVADPDYGNSNYYIDYGSFRFEDEEGYDLNSSNPFTYTQPGVGTWSYNGDRTVTFTATEDNIAEGEYSVYYSAKGINRNGGPFGEEVYRSRPTKLTVVVSKCKKLVNPLMPIKVRIKESN